jgi:hypothetical protein
MRHLRVSAAALGICVVLSAGCTGSSGTTTEPPLDPPVSQSAPADVDALALEAARVRLRSILDGEIEPDPLVLRWDQVQARSLLIGAENAAFCARLESSHAGDALASLVAAGLNALSMRLGHKPLPKETETILGFAAGFATASCPMWKPVVNPPALPAPTPEPAWAPAGYLGVVGDPDIVWKWSDPGSYSCSPGYSHCWQVEVLPRDGCTSLDGILTVKDAAGIALDTETAAASSVPAMRVSTIGFGTTLPAAALGELTHLICV